MLDYNQGEDQLLTEGLDAGDHFEDLDASIRQSTERSKLPPVQVLNLARDPSFTTNEDKSPPVNDAEAEEEQPPQVPKTQAEVDT